MLILKGLALSWGFALCWLIFAWAVKGWVHLAFLIPALFIDGGDK